MSNLIIPNITSSTNKSILVRNRDGRVVGKLQGSTLIKDVKGSRHLLRQPRGWCWDIDILTKAKEAGIVKTEIRDTESGLVYSTPLSEFFINGFSLDRGFGEQICLPLKFWQVVGLGNSKAKPIQPYLF